MAKLGADELIDEVQAACGRTGDTELVTDTRVTRWINEAQREVAERVPGLLCLDLNEIDAFACVTDGITYSLKDITGHINGNHLSDATSYNWVAHTYNLYYRNGSESYRLDFKTAGEFDEVIDPTDTDFSPDKPSFWTRRGDNLYVRPLIDSEYSGDSMRLVGSWYPLDFTVGSSCESDLDDADQGIINWATMKAWGRIGGDKGTKNESRWRQKFEDWLFRYKSRNDTMHEWDANLYGDYE